MTELLLPGLEPDRHLKHALHLRADDTGCGFDRCFAPTLALNERPDLGWQSSCLMKANGKMIHLSDLILGQRLCTNHVMPFWEAVVAHPHCKAVYEVDDLLLAVEPTNPGSFIFYQNPEIRQNLRKAMSMSEAMIVSCEPLKEELSEFNDNIYVIPNYLDAKYVLDKPKSQTGELVTIGWAGGSSHKQDVLTVRKALNKYLRKNSKYVEFHNIGQYYLDIFDEGNVRFSPWFSFKGQYLDELDFDIGLCLLRDSHFNRSKTAVKALEYAARGVPVLASAVTPYKEYVEHGKWGFLYRNEEEFLHYLKLLVHDEELRLEMGTAALSFAREHTFQARIHERVAIYDEIVGKRTATYQGVSSA